jgi:hypothetical protein
VYIARNAAHSFYFFALAQHLMNKTLRPCVYELQAMEEMERKWKLIASEIHAERLPLAPSAEPVAVAVGDRPTPRLDDIQVPNL